MISIIEKTALLLCEQTIHSQNGTTYKLNGTKNCANIAPSQMLVYMTPN